MRIRHPELFQSTSVTDTVLIPGFSFDTTFVFSSFLDDFFRAPVKISSFPFILGDRINGEKNNKIDTFNIEKKLEYGQKKDFKLQIIRNKDSLRVTGKLPTDTVYKTIPVETYKVCERKHLEDFVKVGLWVGSIIVGILFLLFIFVFIKNNFL
jgi:hypothetical protein